MTNTADTNLDEAAARNVAPGERDLCEEVEAYVIAQPWRALSIALAVGFVIGRFIL